METTKMATHEGRLHAKRDETLLARLDRFAATGDFIDPETLRNAARRIREMHETIDEYAAQTNRINNISEHTPRCPARCGGQTGSRCKYSIVHMGRHSWEPPR